MSADSRYVYHPTSQAGYEYQYSNAHPPTSYDNSPVQHAPPPLRNMRSTSSISSQPPPPSPQTQYHSPTTQSPYPPAHSPYSPQGHYMTHTQPAPPPPPPPAQHTPPPQPQHHHQQQHHQQQWSAESWSPHYSNYPSHVSHQPQPQPQLQQQQQTHPPPPPSSSSSSSLPPESPYNSAQGRPDASPTLSTGGVSSVRGYDDRATVHARQPVQPQPQPQPMNGAQVRVRHREGDSPSNSQPASPNAYSTGWDHTHFQELMKHIKYIETPARDGLMSFRSPHPETLASMVQAATYAAQMLDSAAGIVASPTSPSAPSSYHQHQAPSAPASHHGQGAYGRPSSNPRSHEPDGYGAMAQQSPHMNGASPSPSAPARRRSGHEDLQPRAGVSPSTSQPPPPPPSQQGQQQGAQQSGSTSQTQTQTQSQSQEGQTCLGCNATSTPEWRRGPMGPRTLCNACGLVYAKLIKKRDRERTRAGGKATNGTNGSSRSATAQEDSGSDSDDDEEGPEDYNSGTSGRRSEMGHYRE